ncbi:MAG: NifU N-terminal domain-containing protein [Phycisphaerales bacterium]|nr:NifU N-terminal domain-containing protein [Phycisphaerales bacterium]
MKISLQRHSDKKTDRYTPPPTREDAMGFVVLEVQPTPNPNALKFILNRSISEQSTSFFDAAAAKDHPVASALFEIPGVSSLLLLGDFITVNKRAEAKWPAIKEGVRKTLKVL